MDQEPITTALPPPEPVTLPPGQMPEAPLPANGLFGDYELLAEIARGGMGVVYQARQISLNRIVALKMILAGQIASPADVQRFHSEAEAAANLDHPNIVPIHEVGQLNGQHYFTMKLIDGGNLAQHLPRFRNDARAAARLLAMTSRAVHYAHQRGILHRDLKPANVLLDEQGEPHITDFGLAKRIAGGGNLTQSGAILGTPSYMAPEQGRGEKGLSTAVDVYSLGAIWYELLTGQPPFRAETPLDTILQVLERDPVPPHRLNPSINRDLETICLKCLEKDPARRYESAAALAADLERWLAGETIRARRSTTWERAVKWAKRRPALAALLVVSALSMLSLLVLGVFLWQNAEKRAEMVQNLQTARQELDSAREEKNFTLAQTQAAQEEARRIFYAADMQFAHAAWKADNVQSLLALLERQRPQAGRKDLRGFEWQYLWQLCHGERLSWQGHAVPSASQAIDGQAPVLLVFSPDGKTLASASFDKQIKWWDSATGKPIRAIPLADPIASLGFTPDGKRMRLVVAAKDDGSAFKDMSKHIQDVQSGKATPSLQGLLRSFVFRTVSADGRLAEGVEPFDPARFPSPLSMMALMSSGPESAAAMFSSAIALKGQIMSPMFLALSPDRKLLAIGGNLTPYPPQLGKSQEGGVLLWDLTAQKLRATLRGHNGMVLALAFAPDGRTLASAAVDKTIRLWDVPAAREKTALSDQAAIIMSLNFSTDGKVLASSGSDGAVKLWDAQTGRLRTSYIGHLSLASTVLLSPDGRTLASAGMDGAIKLWDATRTPGQRRISLNRPALALRFLPDGKAALVDQGKNVRLFDSLTGRGEAAHPLGQGLQSLFRGGISPDGKTVAVADFTGVVQIATLSGKQLHRWKMADAFNDVLVFSPDGKVLAVGRGVGNKSGEVVLWDVTTGRRLATLQGHRNRVVALAFSPDGRRLATGSPDGRAKLWELSTGKELRTIQEGEDKISAIAFSPDGTKLAVAGRAALSIRDALTNAELRSVPLYSHHVVEIAFSPDGTRLATAGEEDEDSTKGGGAKLWDVTSGQELLTLGSPTDAIRHIVFSPDGKRLMASRRIGAILGFGGEKSTGELLIWNASDSEAVGKK